MAAADQVDLVAVFGPEHGFRGTAQAGGSEGSYVDERTGLTGLRHLPEDAAHALADIVRRSGVGHDGVRHPGRRRAVLHLHLDDVRLHGRGRRLTGKRFVVLDRPNPIERPRAARPGAATRRSRPSSGGSAICQQHGMTVGELARLFDAEFLPDETGKPLQVDVVRMRGWDRGRLLRRHRPALGAAVAQHADAGHRAGLPGHLPVRGDEPVRGPRHDPAVRAGRRAVRRRALGRRAARPGTAGRARSGRRTSRRRSPSSSTQAAPACSCT